jgi:hypothetical protein
MSWSPTGIQGYLDLVTSRLIDPGRTRCHECGLSLCRFEGDRGLRCNRCNAARQPWQIWRLWQSNPCMFVNLKDYRETESLSLRHT